MISSLERALWGGGNSSAAQIQPFFSLSLLRPRRILPRPPDLKSRVSMVWANTSQFWHTFIFLAQLPWTFPWQIVPLMNQHKPPILNSQAGQASRFSDGQFRISQQGRDFPGITCLVDIKKSNCRSICTGTLRHPCSKL